MTKATREVSKTNIDDPLLVRSGIEVAALAFASTTALRVATEIQPLMALQSAYSSAISQALQGWSSVDTLLKNQFQAASLVLSNAFDANATAIASMAAENFEVLNLASLASFEEALREMMNRMRDLDLILARPSELLDEARAALTSIRFDEEAVLKSADDDLASIIDLLSEDFRKDDEFAFEDRFRLFIIRYRLIGLRTFERYSLTEGGNLAAIGEGLRELGRMNDPNTEGQRMQLLRKFLTHPAPSVRDAAGLGLSLFGDKRAIPFLERAIRIEKRPLCKLTLEKALSELRP